MGTEASSLATAGDALNGSPVAVHTKSSANIVNPGGSQSNSLIKRISESTPS
jgi:hypothetical protein